ncbi:MAG: pantoate--beta-alanine ligase, partial [Daejeonella sp.]
MKIVTTRLALSEYLKQRKLEGNIIGLVPTMGALHDGHLSLIEIAKSKTDLVVCSIFVNPTQFTDLNDLKNYPRPVETDINKLEAISCDVLFLPEVEEMYNKDEIWQLDLGGLDQVLEGKIRPGHYQGVTQIVYKLFEIVKPDFAFFGQKDYQQFMVISKMVNLLNMPVKLVVCPIIREDDGLAMSSRNIH